MKKKLYAGMLLTSILTGSLESLETHAEEVTFMTEKNKGIVDISTFSSSLGDLGSQSTIMQMYGLTIWKHAGINFIEVPSLLINQDLLKRDTCKWIQELHPQLITLNETSKDFIDTLQTLLQHDQLTKDKIKRMLQPSIVDSQYEARKLINHLNTFNKDNFKNHQAKFDDSIQQADKILKDDKGNYIQLKKDIEKIQVDMKRDLESISSLPGILTTHSVDITKAIWNLVFPLVKGSTQAILDNTAAGEKVLNDVLQKAKNEAVKAGKTVDEINKILEDVKKDFLASPEGSAVAAAASHKFDFMEKVDIEQIKNMIDKGIASDNELFKQKDAILNLAMLNNQLYEKTRSLEISTLRSVQMLFLKAQVHAFSDQIDEELRLLEKYNEDWNIICKVIDSLPDNPTKSDLYLLKKLSGNLKEQTDKFSYNIDHLESRR